MFLGHVGIALGAKSLVPRISLGTLLAASLFIDLLRPVMALARIHILGFSGKPADSSALIYADFSLTHSLLAVLLWATLFAGFYFLIRRNPREAWICAVVVISNWLLDLVTLHPDLTLVPGISMQAGLNIFEYLPAVLAVELSVFTIGIGFYCYYTKATDRTGLQWFWGILALLVLISVAEAIGPSPENPFVSACCGQFMWFLVIWGYWIEKHRALRWLYN